MACTKCVGCKLALCSPGLYGTNCNQTCNPNCRAVPCSTCSCEVCNQVTGNCTNGCDSGWYGAKCEYVCPDKCELTKGLNEICDRDIGVCLNGCQTSFYGDKCNNTCYTGCLDSLCEKPNGTCVKGCIDGYVGEVCGGSKKNGLGGDEVAGAIGGAFVITLWAAVVIVLICVIWRRRLKDYEAFNRNTNFDNEPNRTSSRRHLRRHSSHSSLSGSANHSLEEDQNSGQLNRHIPLHEKRSVKFETESPIHCTCSHGGSREFYVCRGGMEEQEEYEHNLQNHLHEFHVHYTNGQDTAHLSAGRASSEGDLSELSAVWKPFRY